MTKAEIIDEIADKLKTSFELPKEAVREDLRRVPVNTLELILQALSPASTTPTQAVAQG